jgi:hypothetical protein
MQEMTNEINKIKRWFFLISVAAVVDNEPASQVTNCRGTSEIGCPLQTHQKTTTLLVKPAVAKVPHGLRKAAHSMSGNLPDRSCGSMVNVCLL